jgi:signal transduction histidine kinase
LINDILDLSKIESGYISTDFIKVKFHEITSFVETTFKHISESKNLRFNIEMDEGLPDNLETDIQRLNQILKNLLSNAFKFTEKGEVWLKVYEAKKPGSKTIQALIRPGRWLHSRSKIRVSVFRKTSRTSSSKHSSKQKDPLQP